MLIFCKRALIPTSKYSHQDCGIQNNLITFFRYVSSKHLNWSDRYTPVELNYRNLEGKTSSLPVVICHGMLGTHQNWSVIGKKINQITGKGVYLPDMRNHGSSPHSDAMSYYDMASDINNFIEKHKLGSVVLIGKNA